MIAAQLTVGMEYSPILAPVGAKTKKIKAIEDLALSACHLTKHNFGHMVRLTFKDGSILNVSKTAKVNKVCRV